MEVCVDWQAYENPAVVAKYATTHSLPAEVARAHFQALKHFLKQCSSSSLEHFPSKELDEVWHTFILFTEDYYEFCGRYLERFVHHYPGTNRTKINKDGGVYCYINVRNKSCMSRRIFRTRGELKKIVLYCDSGGNCKD